eukprot:Platyproteum_vivax@DN8688_c0_g1_i1.p1
MAMQAKIPVRKFRPPEGESWEDVNGRGMQFFLGLLSTHFQVSNAEVAVSSTNPQNKDGVVLSKLAVSSEKPNRKVVVFSHGGYIREFLNACFCGADTPCFANVMHNCAYCHLLIRLCSVEEGEATNVPEHSGNKAAVWMVTNPNNEKQMVEVVLKEENCTQHLSGFDKKERGPTSASFAC